MATSHAYTPRINGGGNFCGHDPQNPSLSLAARFSDGFPGVLSRLMERLQRYYEAPRYWLPSLEAANGSTRQQRSERREALVLLMCAILKHTELSSLRCGVPTAGGFIPFDMKYLANVAGLSLTRAIRAMEDLRRGGVISIHQARLVNDLGEYRGYPAVRRINPLIFRIFGLGHMLDRARKAAAQRLKRIAETITDRSTHSGTVLKLKLFLDASAPVRTLRGARHGRQGFSPPEGGEPLVRQQSRLMGELIEAHPEWTSQQLLAEVRRRLG